MTEVRLSVYDRNAEKVGDAEVVTFPTNGTQQGVARIDVTRRQLMVLGITIPGRPLLEICWREISNPHRGSGGDG